MPWLLPVLKDLASDGAATSHKLRYFENAATPNLAIHFDQTMALQTAKDFIELVVPVLRERGRLRAHYDEAESLRDAMLAVSMNGEPLPIEHGFPVRMVVPGLYGYVSATKWVTELELTTFATARCAQ